jgi:hypothetical protein
MSRHVVFDELSKHLDGIKSKNSWCEIMMDNRFPHIDNLKRFISLFWNKD